MIPYDTHNLIHVLFIVLFYEGAKDEARWRKCEAFCLRAILQQFKRQVATLILFSELVLTVFFDSSPSSLLSQRRVLHFAHFRLSGRTDGCSEQAPCGHLPQRSVPSNQ